MQDIIDRVQQKERENAGIIELMRQSAERLEQTRIQEALEESQRREQEIIMIQQAALARRALAKKDKMTAPAKLAPAKRDKPTAPPLTDLAIADILKKCKPECPQAQEFIKNAEETATSSKQKAPPPINGTRRARPNPLSRPHSMTEQEHLDGVTRAQMATLRLQQILKDMPDDEE
jgi:hypothetical protein